MFDVADTPFPYNGILGHPALAKFMAVSLFAYNMMMIPAPWGVLTVKANVGDAVLCVQKLNLAIAATLGNLQRAQEAGDVAHFKEDPKMTKKVALTHDGSRSITIGARYTDK